jgi:hypothetical protein
MKKLKKTAAAHTTLSSKGVGDFYGSGIRNKIGRSRDVMGISEIPSKKLKNPPKSMA